MNVPLFIEDIFFLVSASQMRTLAAHYQKLHFFVLIQIVWEYAQGFEKELFLFHIGSWPYNKI